MNKSSVQFKGVFETESGGKLNNIEVTYHTAGTLTANSKVVWICHALTANSNPEEWWPGVVGEGKLYNSADYFIICANILGSCYGTTGPLSENNHTKAPYYSSFPNITVRDMVKVHNMLRQHLGIEKIHTVIGSSIGGFQALEYAMLCPNNIQHLILMATNCRVTPWATAFNEAQRMAIYADSTYFTNTPEGGKAGMESARAMALLSYRSYEGYNSTQGEADVDTLFADKASSYERYQGKKLSARFNAYSYVCLAKAIDSHNCGRNRGGVEKALASVKPKTLIIGINGDLLFPPVEQRFMSKYIPNAQYAEILSDFGHDGFLLESVQISKLISDFCDE